MTTRAIRKAWVEWVMRQMPKPKSMITLTYENDVHPDHAKENLQGLIRALNSSVLGENYQNVCKHSYFSYVAVMERQLRGVLHWHMVVDAWVDYVLIHRWWPLHCGFAWCAKVNDPENIKSGGTGEGSIRYLAKYLTKDAGDLLVWFSEKQWIKSTYGIVAVQREDGPTVKVPSDEFYPAPG
jgi:hypothetical protein